MVELGINIDENTISDEQKQTLTENQSAEINNNSLNESEELKNIDESIESIPFIADPSKDKKSKTK